MVIKNIVSEHAEDAAFLWQIRDAAVHAPNFDLDELAELDERVEAHIDGLRVGREFGWQVCAEELENNLPGEVFVTTVLALESQDPNRLGSILEIVEAKPETNRGLISAFGWVSPEKLRGTVRELLVSKSPFRRRAGIAACAVHRVNPNTALDTAVRDDDLALQARALRAAGELGRHDLLSVLEERLSSDDMGVRFWAAWSAVLLGDRGRGLGLLRSRAVLESSFKGRAAQVALRAMNPADTKGWLTRLTESPEGLRDVIVGAGIAGDPAYVPWLIKQMETPELARVAGEAFSTITGIDLTDENLEGQLPEEPEEEPAESPEDEEVGMDPDEDLPWPHPQLVRKWWNTNKNRFVDGQRYLVSEPITAAHCHRVLAGGNQRQRASAALELALMKADAPVYETRAPGFRQRRARGQGASSA